jgi:hypothetical protein
MVDMSGVLSGKRIIDLYVKFFTIIVKTLDNKYFEWGDNTY